VRLASDRQAGLEYTITAETSVVTLPIIFSGAGVFTLIFGLFILGRES